MMPGNHQAIVWKGAKSYRSATIWQMRGGISVYDGPLLNEEGFFLFPPRLQFSSIKTRRKKK
ncbi:hypothetical protein NCCP2050_12570 [Planococcus sp. NCCP-2050]|nr:hypothetical protein NCCP2050_12570 [Planococcus sp. NCCP-2050]